MKGNIEMESVIQGLVGLSGLFLLALGTRTMFAPKAMFDILAIKPEGPPGLNTIRGFLGGLFIGSSIVLATGLYTGNTTFFLTVAMTMGVVVIGRWVGIALDGFHKKVAFPLVAEMVMVSIFIIAYINL